MSVTGMLQTSCFWNGYIVYVDVGVTDNQPFMSFRYENVLPTATQYQFLYFDTQFKDLRTGVSVTLTYQDIVR